MANIQEAEKARALTVAEAGPGLAKMIEDSAKELRRALPEHMRPERLVRIALTCIRQNPKLQQCTPMSFLGALFTSAQVGLEPIMGRAHIIPYNNGYKDQNGKWQKRMEAQFMIGYLGYKDLFYRHEKATSLWWGIVREGDEFEYQKGTEQFLNHKPRSNKTSKALKYYVGAKLANGGQVFEVMSAEDCLSHGQAHSKTWVTKSWDEKTRRMIDCTPHFDGPWATDTDSMCLKTVLIQVNKLLPTSVELQKAFSADETSREYREGIADIFDSPNRTEWNTKEPAGPPLAEPGQIEVGDAQEPVQGEVTQITMKPIKVSPIEDESRKIPAYLIVDSAGGEHLTENFLVAKACKESVGNPIKVLEGKGPDGKTYVYQVVK